MSIGARVGALERDRLAVGRPPEAAACGRAPPARRSRRRRTRGPRACLVSCARLPAGRDASHRSPSRTNAIARAVGRQVRIVGGAAGIDRRGACRSRDRSGRTCRRAGPARSCRPRRRRCRRRRGSRCACARGAPSRRPTAAPRRRRAARPRSRASCTVPVGRRARRGRRRTSRGRRAPEQHRAVGRDRERGRDAEPEVEGRGGVGEQLVVEGGPGHGCVSGQPVARPSARPRGQRGRHVQRERRAACARRSSCRFLAPASRRLGRFITCAPSNVGTAAPTRSTQALRYQLAACCEDGRIEAMVVADGDGLPLASSGDTYACDEVAARMVLVGAAHQGVQRHAARRRPALGRADDEGRGRRLRAPGVRRRRHAPRRATRQITRGAEGALRILAVA